MDGNPFWRMAMLAWTIWIFYEVRRIRKAVEWGNGYGPCEDCGERGPLIEKGDHHGGTKKVCVDRDACHGRSPG